MLGLASVKQTNDTVLMLKLIPIEHLNMRKPLSSERKVQMRGVFINIGTLLQHETVRGAWSASDMEDFVGMVELSIE